MTGMAHDELRELTGGYVLDALSDAERRALDAHLATCAECAREVRELRAVAGGLAYAVPQIDPPAALRDRVLAHAVQGPRTSSRTSAHERPARAAVATWLAAAASIAAIALGLYAMTLRQRVNQLEHRLREANTRAEGTQRELQAARAAVDRGGRTEAVLSAPDLRRIDLAGQKAAPSAVGRAYWSPSRGLVFTAASLPPLPAGKQYQLWVIPPGSKVPVNAGMIDLEPGGRAVTLVDAATAASVGTVAVTVEPTGGVPSPTGDMALAGSL